MKIISTLLAATLAMTVCGSAFAQAPAPAGTPSRIRGTIETLDGNNLKVKSRDGQELTVKLADNFTVRAAQKVNLADIKSNDYVGIAAVKGPNGKLRAQSVQVFQESQRGVGEGQVPWDLTPDSSMTNATVGEVTAAPLGRSLTLKYKGADTQIEVPDNAPVFTTIPADKSLLTAGKFVVIGARKLPDGTLTAAGVSVEKDGVKPAN